MKRLRDVAVKHLYLYALLPPILAAILWITLPLAVLPHVEGLPHTLVLIAACVVSYFLLKAFLIGLVLVYKAFAPMSLRRSCRFTPTCSTYMIMAINKYGILIGVAKGLHRLFRCKPPNGGVDYP